MLAGHPKTSDRFKGLGKKLSRRENTIGGKKTIQREKKKLPNDVASGQVWMKKRSPPRAKVRIEAGGGALQGDGNAGKRGKADGHLRSFF